MSSDSQNSEPAALRALLDAVDAGSADLPRLVAARPRKGILFGAFEQAGLSDIEVTVLLAALSARSAGRRSLTGGDLATKAAGDSAGRLSVLALLDQDGRLISRGLLVPQVLPSDGPEAQSTSFRLGRHVFRLACDVFGSPTERETPEQLRPYRSASEVLADLRRLSLIYRRRAARLFHVDPWEDFEPDVDAGRIRAEARRVEQRLKMTAPGEGQPLLQLRARHGLDLDGLVILVTMLYQEIVEGVGAVDAVDLVRLVSKSESDLIRRRAVLRPLARKGLIRLEGAYGGKELTADASLPNGLVEEMLGAQDAIDESARHDFHSYLQQLESSDPFFTDLEGGDDDDPPD